MRALTFHGLRDIRCEQVADPALREPGDVIVEVERAAICGSDLHVYHERERGVDLGCVMGHELAGRIVDRGPEVSDFRTGDRVVCPFTTSCGRCFFCLRGLTARCERGALFGWVERGRGLPGVQAEYVRVPMADATLIRAPEGVDPDVALLLGDVLPTGYYCAERADIARDPAGVYAVVGCGPVGLMAVLAAGALGAERVYAIDLVPERLALAARFGAIAINAGDAGARDPVDIVGEATDGRGADAVMELVGSPEAAALAYRLVRPGGTLSIAGVHTAPAFAFSPAQAYDKNLTVRSGRCPARGLTDRVTPLLHDRAGDLGAVITHRLPLTAGPDAYRMFDTRTDGCVKVVLTP